MTEANTEIWNGRASRIAPQRICVFCGARPGDEGAVKIARETGRLIAELGHQLVYGGGGSGLMGELAWSAYRHGAPVTGIIPEFLFERERSIAAPPAQVIRTDSMFSRKQLMLELADSFLALPGGYGTLDEVLEVVSLASLGQLDKPLVMLDDDGYWDGFVEITSAMRVRGFLGGAPDCFVRAGSPYEALDHLTAARPTAGVEG